jgi:hypothetical protein
MSADSLGSLLVWELFNLKVQRFNGFLKRFNLCKKLFFTTVLRADIYTTHSGGALAQLRNGVCVHASAHMHALMPDVFARAPSP